MFQKHDALELGHTEANAIQMMAADIADAQQLASVVSDVEQARERAMIAAEKEAWERHIRAKDWR